MLIQFTDAIMKTLHLLTLIIALQFSQTNLMSTETNYLQECWKKQVFTIHGKYLQLSYQEELNELEHSYYPWQQTNYKGKGECWINAHSFIKKDSLSPGNYFSKTQLINNQLLLLDYGNTKLSPVTQQMTDEQTYKSARYSPTMIIAFFLKNNVSMDYDRGEAFVSYTSKINNAIVKLFIRKSDQLVEKISTLSDDELFGDVLSVYHYSNYESIQEVYCPKEVEINKVNGKLTDKVTIRSAKISSDVAQLIPIPENYTIAAEQNNKPETVTEKYNDRIWFVFIKHTDARVMMVAFNDFLVVVDAPLNSENGASIIKSIREIFPYKPIRYFSFSHYHPYALGGVRPFILEGATILCSDINEAYLHYIYSNPRTLNPDSLQLHPRALVTKSIKDSLTISDGDYTLELFFIGNTSAHTNDFVIYYLPKEKLVFENDLAWIEKGNTAAPADTRTKGLYKAIKERKLAVDTIIQSWPATGYGIISIIPFELLEQAATMK
jgi:glyoxylase-like metal-dependent hydrolase (beta-lactamase superfamily II)